MINEKESIKKKINLDVDKRNECMLNVNDDDVITTREYSSDIPSIEEFLKEDYVDDSTSPEQFFNDDVDDGVISEEDIANRIAFMEIMSEEKKKEIWFDTNNNNTQEDMSIGFCNDSISWIKQPMQNSPAVTSNIIQRVLKLKILDRCCSSFTIELEEQQYIVTCKHCFKDAGYPKNLIIQINKDSKWQKLEVNIYYHTNKNVDLAVIHPGEGIFITPVTDIDSGLEDTFISQDCYIIGFPATKGLPDKGINQGYPLPYIKKGIISGINIKDKSTIIIVDGYGDQHGSSGSPILIKNSKNRWQIIGVLCSVNDSWDYVTDQKGLPVTLGFGDEIKKLCCTLPIGLSNAYAFHHVIEIINES